MIRRSVLAALPLLALLAAAAPPRNSGALPPPPPPLAAIERVAIVTELGTIELALDGAHAPVSTANFLRYVDARRLDGITFYRAMHLAWGDQPNGLVQGGLRDPRRLFPPIAHEPTSQTGVLHKAGTISMARNAPGTAAADFSILLSDISALDANPASADPEVQAGYAAFGHVTAGMEVVRAIWDAPISATLGEGVMRGQMLDKPVKVLSVRRLAPAIPPATASTPPAP
jgi:peptidyl-prolyl cis-trans isomerase A (cyclophilin A)